MKNKVISFMICGLLSIGMIIPVMADELTIAKEIEIDEDVEILDEDGIVDDIVEESDSNIVSENIVEDDKPEIFENDINQEIFDEEGQVDASEMNEDISEDGYESGDWEWLLAG